MLHLMICPVSFRLILYRIHYSAHQFDLWVLQVALIKELLQLVKNCLAYDFIGTSFDESTDDMGTVHIPTQWKQGESKLR